MRCSGRDQVHRNLERVFLPDFKRCQVNGAGTGALGRRQCRARQHQLAVFDLVGALRHRGAIDDPVDQLATRKIVQHMPGRWRLAVRMLAHADIVPSDAAAAARLIAYADVFQHHPHSTPERAGGGVEALVKRIRLRRIAELAFKEDRVAWRRPTKLIADQQSIPLADQFHGQGEILKRPAEVVGTGKAMPALREIGPAEGRVYAHRVKLARLDSDHLGENQRLRLRIGQVPQMSFLPQGRRQQVIPGGTELADHDGKAEGQLSIQQSAGPGIPEADGPVFVRRGEQRAVRPQIGCQDFGCRHGEVGYWPRATVENTGDTGPMQSFEGAVAGIQIQRADQPGQRGGVIAVDHLLRAHINMELSQMMAGDPMRPPALPPRRGDHQTCRQHCNADPPQHGVMSFQPAQALDRRASFEQGQIRQQFLGAVIPTFGVLGASPEQHFVELEQFPGIRPLPKVRRQSRVILSVQAGADFVEQFAETVEVGLRIPGSLGWQITLGADDRVRIAYGRHQPDVGQLRNAMHENDVRRLHVPVHQRVVVEMFQGRRQGRGQRHAFLHRHSSSTFQVFLQRPRDVGLRIQRTRRCDRGTRNIAPRSRFSLLHTLPLRTLGFAFGIPKTGLFRVGIVRQLGDVVKVFLAPPDVQDLHQVRLGPGDGLILQEPFVLAGERAVAGEILAVDDFDGAERAHDIAGEPDGPVSAPADATEQPMIGNGGKRRCGLPGGCLRAGSTLRSALGGCPIRPSFRLRR